MSRCTNVPLQEECRKTDLEEQEAALDDVLESRVAPSVAVELVGCKLGVGLQIHQLQQPTQNLSPANLLSKHSHCEKGS